MNIDNIELKKNAALLTEMYACNIINNIVDEILRIKFWKKEFELLNKLREMGIEILFLDMCIVFRIFCTTHVTVMPEAVKNYKHIKI